MKPSISFFAQPGWLAALVLCATLTACGGDSNDSKPADPAQPGQPGQPPAVTPQLRCAP
ncbi:hypothetical protein OR16_39129 [Cupriavidus basilensis OR16]|uniref:Lipoprotein n=1 Tax=Cupriavidus basilensis OR16 TaxID=1127483 RepID=H1SHB3_9BURK|nr:hypothetical protein [Cupriavidus basilensis]EHP38104.1 hypothetical protein OR16_39129 [Cupriavidus basilensis OR16]